jgi:hypothetical protein
MANFQEPLGARRDYQPAVASSPSAQTIKSVLVIAALIGYAMLFLLLYPIAQSSVSKSAAEGNDPAALEPAGP